MKSSYQKQCLKIALLIWLILLMIWLMIWLMGCSSARHYKLDCTDYASLAGHSAEMRIGGAVWVAIDYVHAQAYLDTGGAYPYWLAIDNGYLIVNATREVEEIRATYSLEDWDYLMKEIWSRGLK